MPLLADPHGGVFVQYDQAGKGHVVMDTGGPHAGVSPYVFDNENGVPSLADALAGSAWAPAKSSAALVLGAVPAPRQPAASAASGTPQAVTVNVVMDDFYFEPLPEGFTVPSGALVTFSIVNNGQAVHNLTTTDFGIKPYDVAAVASGEVAGAAPRAGTYTFICTYHPGMEGTIIVR